MFLSVENGRNKIIRESDRENTYQNRKIKKKKERIE
jgi:hypothetical protein